MQNVNISANTVKYLKDRYSLTSEGIAKLLNDHQELTKVISDVMYAQDDLKALESKLGIIDELIIIRDKSAFENVL